MKDSFKFDYFYGSQAEQFSFFRLPKILIRDEQFKKISVWHYAGQDVFVQRK